MSAAHPCLEGSEQVLDGLAANGHGVRNRVTTLLSLRAAGKAVASLLMAAVSGAELTRLKAPISLKIAMISLVAAPPGRGVGTESYFNTSACSGNRAALPLGVDAAAAGGAASFFPVSWNLVPSCEKRKGFPLWSLKNCGSSTVK